MSDPEIQAALAADLADAVTANLQLPDSVVEQLPPALDRLKPVLRSAVNDLAEHAFGVIRTYHGSPISSPGVVTRGPTTGRCSSWRATAWPTGSAS